VRQINPFYIAFLLIAILAFVGFKLMQAKEAHKEAVASLEQTDTMARRIVALKSAWDGGDTQAKALQRMLAGPLFTNAGVTHTLQKGRMVISADAIERNTADQLLGKLFNGSYVIDTVEIRRLDDTRAALRMEVLL